MDTDGQVSETAPALAEEAAVIARKGRPGLRDAEGVGTGDLDERLERRIDDLVREAEKLSGRPFHRSRRRRRSDSADERLRAALSVVRGGLRRRRSHPDVARTTELVACALELQELSQQVCDRRLEERSEALGNVARALSRLGGIDSTQRLMERSTHELCRSCGFDRAMLFRTDGTELVAESVEFSRDPAWARNVLEFAKRARPRLGQGVAEAEALRRRTPLLVRDVQERRKGCPLIIATDTQAYVVAPIVPEGKVVGFLHADRYFCGDPMDELDRDVLSAFAEGFGYALARTALLQRFRSEHRRLLRMLRLAEASMSQISASHVDLVSSTDEPKQDDRLRDLRAPSLTRRQREIIELMSEGATNAEIANRLVLAEDTVKFHVRQILKRMQAANRAEAVSRYLRRAAEGSAHHPSRQRFRRGSR